MTNVFFHGNALLIGVGADLPITVQDATALRDVLQDPDRAAYPREQVELLTEEKADREGILAGFDRLITRVKNEPGATVIVYFSGHGGRIERPDDSPEYFLVPYGYDPGQRRDTAISGSEFTDKIEKIQASKLVVFLDCCHAGGVPALKDPGESFVKSPVLSDLLNALDAGSGRVVIASSHEEEYSYTGTPYSVFTTCLLEALSGKAAVNKDGYARILDALIYLYKYVPERSNDQQHPFVKKVLDLGDNFPICYYAGSSKHVSSEAPEAVSQAVPQKLTSGQRRRLEQKLDTLRGPRDLLIEKIGRMRTALMIEASEAVKFQLEKQLLDEEARLAHLESEIDEIENALRPV